MRSDNRRTLLIAVCLGLVPVLWLALLLAPYLDGGLPELLRELADDMLQGCPMELGRGLFDDDWDRKYIHGGRD